MAKLPDLPESPAARLQREREQTRALLSEGYAHDHIDQEELDRRLELAESASTVAALQALTVELRPVTTALVPVTSTALASAPERVRVILGSVERVGAWSVQSCMHARVRLGSLLLDLREASLPDGDLELVVSVVLGNLDIVVPPGWYVDNRCGVVLGSIDQEAPSAGGQRRVLRLTGRVVLGSLTVQVRLPGEPRDEARRKIGEAKVLGQGRARPGES